MTSKMHVKKVIPTLLAGLFLLASPAKTQINISLTDCLIYGLANNPTIQKASLETDRSEKKVSEIYSALYPQIRANASINDNLKLQTSILPGEIFGQPGQTVAVQFGTQYNVTTAVDVSQVIFDPGIITGVRLANQSIDMAALSQDLTEEQLLYNIAQAYYAAQITVTQKEILQQNLKNMDSLVIITRVKLENDFVLQTDYDRVVINQANLQTQIFTLEQNYDKQLRLLKYLTGIPLDSAVTVGTAMNELSAPVIPEYSSSGTLDMRMLQMQQEMYYLNIKQIQSGYIPNLSLSFRYAYMAQQNDLNVFGSGSKWYPMSYLTLNLSVPVFDGFSKHRKVQQLEIEMDKNKLDQEYTKSYLDMQYQNALGNIEISMASMGVYKQNIELAQKLYDTTKKQFVGNVSSLSDLLNAETALNQAQSNYMSALIQVKIAQLDLLKGTGNIKLILQ
ncbi:MAG: TolC family protein [Bacteroidetes bacterium]|nr:TolC family protein [Bacteroidota bacterium]